MWEARYRPVRSNWQAFVSGGESVAGAERELARAAALVRRFAAGGALLPGRGWLLKERVILRVQEDRDLDAGHFLPVGQGGDLKLRAFTAEIGHAFGDGAAEIPIRGSADTALAQLLHP